MSNISAKQTLDAVTKKVLYGIIEFGPMGQAFQRLGLVVVPKEPTEAMLDVAGPAIDAYYDGTKDAPFEGGVAAVWRAMIEASQAENLGHAKEQGEDKAKKEHGHGETP